MDAGSGTQEGCEILLLGSIQSTGETRSLATSSKFKAVHGMGRGVGPDNFQEVLPDQTVQRFKVTLLRAWRESKTKSSYLLVLSGFLETVQL